MRADRSRLPDVGADPPFAFPAIRRHALASGMALRTVEHHSAPVVTFVLQVDAGAGNDPAGAEGLAALTADMADEGTGSLTAIDISDAIARIGAEYDVEVAGDATIFTLTTLTRHAERGASLLADLIARPSLRDVDLDRVRQLRLDRLRQLKDVPPAIAERAFLRVLYGDHPYGHLAIGSDASLAGLSVADVRAFHAAAYRPKAATLVIAGAMAHDELAGLAHGAFGAWAAAAGTGLTLTPPASIAPPADAAARLTIVPREGAAQSELRIGQLSARRDTPDYPALLVMNAIMGGQFVSRINLKLREEKGYTYGARTGFDWRRGLAPFVLQASVHTAATADAVRESLREIDGIRGARPPSDSELTLAKASLTRGYPRNFETAQQVARSVAQLALFGLADDYFEQFVPRVQAVTAADVTAAAQRYIDPARLATLIVGDHAVIAEGVAELGIGAAEVTAAAE